MAEKVKWFKAERGRRVLMRENEIVFRKSTIGVPGKMAERFTSGHVAIGIDTTKRIVFLKDDPQGYSLVWEKGRNAARVNQSENVKAALQELTHGKVCQIEGARMSDGITIGCFF